MIGGLAMRFLGIDDDADVYDLLGLPRGQVLPAARIEQALLHRLGQLYAHPEGRSPDAEALRERLRNAADSLKRYMTRLREKPIPAAPPAHAAHRLTDFDRHVLATMIVSGGWNAVARSRLIALASSQGVTVQGLMKVIRGLSEYAHTAAPERSGAGIGPVQVSQITAGMSKYVPAAPPPSPIAELSDRIVERLAATMKDDTGAGTLKLTIAFGLIAAIIAIILVAKLYPIAQPVVRESIVAGTTLPPTDSSRDSSAPQEEPTSVARPAEFAALPTFADMVVPLSARQTADDVKSLLKELDEIGRRLVVSTDPAEMMYRSWEYAVSMIAGAWPLLDREATRQIDQAIANILLASADRPSVSNRMMRAFAPSGEILGEPLDLWRGAWRAGSLARISRNPVMPAALRDDARRLLEATLGEDRASGMRHFDAAADVWLRRSVPTMLNMLRDDEPSYQMWELWLIAQRKLGVGARHDRAIMHAMTLAMRSRGDIGRQNARLNVVGRLLRTVDFTSSAVVRDRFLDLFDDAEVSSASLWVLTSILAQDPRVEWYGGDLVIPHDAPDELRRRFSYDIRRLWPAIEESRWIASRRAFEIDETVHRLWLEAHDALLAEQPTRSIGTDEERMQRLVNWARLNEAAALLAAQQPMYAELALRAISSEPGAPPRGPAPGVPSNTNPQGIRPPGINHGHITGGPAGGRAPVSIGPDGVWAAAYEESRQRSEDRIRLLQQLRNAGGDLEPRNAAVFVREAYRGAADARSLAQSIAVEQFMFGPNVAVELLDQLVEAPRHVQVGEFLQRYTGTLLPPVRASDWMIEARRSLLEHTLRLRMPETAGIDLMASVLAESMLSQAAALRPEKARRAHAAAGSPTDAARQLAEAWRETAVATLAVTAFPEDVPGLDRRYATRLYLASGPMQEFVASQIAVLELLIYVVAAEQPPLLDELAGLASYASERRAGARHVLDQAGSTEQSIASLWRWRLGAEPLAYDEEELMP